MLFHDRDVFVAWAALPAGALALFALYALARAPTLVKEVDAGRGFATGGLALLALALLRFGLLRLHERLRLLRLLRGGEVVQAVRSTDALFDLRGAVMTVGETSEGPILVATPAPLVAGDVQGLLVGKNGDVVAWDLLPFTPAVDGAGAITVA